MAAWTRRLALATVGLGAIVTSTAPVVGDPPGSRDPTVAPRNVIPDEVAAFPESIEMSGEVRIPITLADSRPSVQLVIDGHGPYRVLLDTAASGLLLDASVIESLNLEVVGIGSMSSPLGDGMEVQRVRIEQAELGDATLVGVIADRWDDPSLFPDADQIAGILGPSLFRDALVTIDFGREELRLGPGKLEPRDEGVIELEWDQFLPVFTLDIAGISVPAHLDSGNSAALILPLGSGVPFESEPELVGRARLIDAEVLVYSARVVGFASLGPWRQENPSVHLIEGFTTANLGIGLLREFALTLDQSSGLARIVVSETAD